MDNTCHDDTGDGKVTLGSNGERMRRLLGLAYVAVLVAVMLLTWSAPQALANHVQCGDVITQDTTLDSDLIDCPDDGIVIGSDNITLDLGGHTVDGDGFPTEHPLECEAGIVNGPWSFCPRPGEASHDHVTIRNGRVRDFSYGVRVLGTDDNLLNRLEVSNTRNGIAVFESSNVVIERNSVSDNATHDAAAIVLGSVTHASVERNHLARNVYGVHAEDLREIQIVRNFVFDNSAGMHLHSAYNNLIAHNHVAGNGTGIELSDGVFDNLVIGNWVFDNANIGIMTQEGDHRNRIERNFVLNNGSLSNSDSAGIHLFGDGDGERVEGNILFGNDRGVVISGSARNVGIERNWIFRNTHGGIVLRNPEHLSSVDRVMRNTVTRNGGDGIFIDAATPDGTSLYILERNVARENEDDGIDAEYPATELTRNSANRNGDLGIEAVPGVTDGGGNGAFGNGNPLQCLNVACR